MEMKDLHCVRVNQRRGLGRLCTGQTGKGGRDVHSELELRGWWGW